MKLFETVMKDEKEAWQCELRQRCTCVALEMPDAEGVGVQLTDKVQGSPGNLTP